MLSFFAGDSPSRKVHSNSGGATLLSLCFHFWMLFPCNRQTLTSVTSQCFYPHFPPSCCLALIQDNWSVQHILLKLLCPCWQINAPLALRGAAFSEKARSLQTPPSECEKYIVLILFRAAKCCYYTNFFFQALTEFVIVVYRKSSRKYMKNQFLNDNNMSKSQGVLCGEAKGCPRRL